MVLFNSENPGHKSLLQEIMKVAPSASVQLLTFDMRDTATLEKAIGDFASQANCGLIVLPDFRISTNRNRIVASAARHRLPGIYPFRSFAVDGGLLFYGVDSSELYRRGAAAYVDRILRGSDPADLPVQAPTKFELVINLKTAKAIGLTIPPTLLARADEVIE
jgi:putative ABC transport system substrate-binding protein